MGRWDSASHRKITSTAPLGPDGTIVHIPLVYSDTQGTGDHPLPTVEALIQATIAMSNLRVLQDLGRMGDNFVQAAIREAESATGSALAAVEERVKAAVARVRALGGGGLPAHNYWDNVAQWIPRMVQILRGVAPQMSQGGLLAAPAAR